MSQFTHISGVPEGLAPGQYDAHLTSIRYVTCRDGTVDMVLEGTFAGPHEPGTAALQLTVDEAPDAAARRAGGDDPDDVFPR
jgi:hypothetical protein